MFERILIVCVGNVCRSPTGAALLRRHLSGNDRQIGSAGLAALAGQRIDPMAGAVLAEHGLDASDHVARQAAPDLLRESDLVLVMEQRHLMQIRRFVPEASGKTFLLDKWVSGRDIPDPYQRDRDAFEQVYAMIEQGVRGWLPYLQ